MRFCYHGRTACLFSCSCPSRIAAIKNHNEVEKHGLVFLGLQQTQTDFCSRSTSGKVDVSGNAQITGTSYGVYAGQSGSSITVEDAAVIKATTGKYSGYGVGCEKITITGGTIQAKEYAVISDFANSIVTIDNSTTQTPIIIDGGIYDVYVHNTTNYNVGGDPEFDTFGTRG